MPRQTLSDRVDSLTESVARLDQNSLTLEKEIDWQLTQIEQLRDENCKVVETIHRLERDLAVLQQQVGDLRESRSKQSDRRYSLTEVLIGAVVNAGLAAVVAYYVARA